MSDLHAFNALIGRMMAPLARRVAMTVSRGVVKLVDASLKMQNLQVELVADEVQDNVEHFEPYGLTAHPFKDAEALFLSVGANRGHGIVACVTDRRHRPKNLAEGDVCLFTDKGERVYLNRLSDVLNLGAKSASDWVALDAKVRTELGLIAAQLTLIATAIGSLGGTYTNSYTTPGSTAATKVKAT